MSDVVRGVFEVRATQPHVPLVEDQPHFIRVVIWNASERRVVFRHRLRVDAARSGVEDPALVASAVHGCEIAMALRGPAQPR